jgi:hypothetical protein
MTLQLRNDHYLLLQLISQREERDDSQSAFGKSLRTVHGLATDWAYTAEGMGRQPGELEEDWAEAAERRCARRLRALTAAGYLRRTKLVRAWVYSLTAKGRTALIGVTLDKFPHKLQIEVLLRQPDVPLADVEQLRGQIEAAAQAAVDALLGIVGRTHRTAA